VSSSFGRELKNDGNHGSGGGGNGQGGNNHGGAHGGGVPENPEERAEKQEHGKMKIMRKTKNIFNML